MNTLIYYIIGDNGASAEGGPRGTFNEMANLKQHRAVCDHGISGCKH